MKKWIRNRKIRKLRDRLLRAKEEQMHHRLVAQHYNNLIHDIEQRLDDIGAYHDDATLINYDFSKLAEKERKVVAL